MSDGPDVFAGLRARLLELEDRAGQLEARLARADVEARRLRAWCRLMGQWSRSRRVWCAAMDALHSARWPEGVTSRRAQLSRDSEED